MRLYGSTSIAILIAFVRILHRISEGLPADGNVLYIGRCLGLLFLVDGLHRELHV